jgi:hypothetical protein
MVLDAVLGDRDRSWLATEQDKLAYFTLTYRIPRQDPPSLTFRAEDVRRSGTLRRSSRSRSTRTTGCTSFCIWRGMSLATFRAFLERDAELLRGLPAWTVRLLVPCHKRDAVRLYEAAFQEQLASPAARVWWRTSVVVSRALPPTDGRA